MVTRKGALVLNIRPQQLDQVIAESSPYSEQSIFICDQNGSILFQSHNAHSLTSSDITSIIKKNQASTSLSVRGRKMAVNLLSSERFDIHYISVIPQNTLYRILGS